MIEQDILTSENELSSKHYWENYYKNSSNSREAISTICGAYDPLWEKWITSCRREPRTIIEIGCYPGRYVSYLASKFGLQPYGIDYNSDREKILETMRLMNVTGFTYYQDDFFNFKPSQRFDLVLSNGFVEHFENFDTVLDLHVEYLSAQGSILIMIPYMRFGQYVYRYLFDKENLEIHNTKCMSLSVFGKFAARHNLRIDYLSYHGPFLTNPHKELSFVKRILHKPVEKVFKTLNPFISRYPNRLLGSSIIGMFSRN